MYNLFHEIDENPSTNQHLAELVDSIRQNGWQGDPLLADGEQLLNGAHRAVACQILEVEPHVHQLEVRCTWGDDPYWDELLSDLANARRTEEIYWSILALYNEGLVDEKSLRLINAEYEREE